MKNLLFALALCLGMTEAMSQSNLLQNGDFEGGQNQHIPEAWQPHPGTGPESVRVVQGDTPNGQKYLLIDQHPDGQQWNNPAPMIINPLDEIPPGFNFDQLNLNGVVSFQSPNEVQIPPIGFLIVFFQDQGGQPQPIAETEFFIEDPNVWQSDGQFRPFQKIVNIPNDVDNSKPLFLDLVILKQTPGQVCLDNLRLVPNDLPNTLSPGIESVQPVLVTNWAPTEINLIVTNHQPGFQVLFNNVAGKILEVSGPNVKVLAPVLPQSGDAHVVLMNPDGQMSQERIGIQYRDMPELHTLDYRLLPNNLGLSINVHGRNLRPDSQWSIAGVPSPGILPEFVSSESVILNILTDTLPPELNVSLIDEPYITGPGFIAVPVMPQLEISEVMPGALSSRGGDILTIHGSGFHKGTRIWLNDKPASFVNLVSENTLHARIPETKPGPVNILASNSGVDSLILPEGLTGLAHLPGDIDGNHAYTLNDVRVGLEWTAGATFIGTRINPNADVNHDGIIGMEEVIRALELAGSHTSIGVDDFPLPTLWTPSPSTIPGVPVNVTVNNTILHNSSVLHWGDGFTTQIESDGIYSHVYNAPGQYTASLHADTEEPASLDIEVTPTTRVGIIDIDLSLMTEGDGGQPEENDFLSLVPGEGFPPELVMEITTRGSGLVHISVEVESPDYSASTPVVLDMESPNQNEKTTSVSLGPVEVFSEGVHIVSVKTGPGTINLTPAASNPIQKVVVLGGFVTKEDCEEIIRQWEALVAKKSTLQTKLQNLKDQLDQQKTQKSQLENEIDAKKDQLDNLQNQRDELHDQMEELVEFMDNFFGDVADVKSYSNSSGLQGSRASRLGARRAGSSQGFGFAFDDPQALSNKFDDYESATGRSIGEDMSRLRDMLKDIENMDEQLDELGTDLVKLRSDLKNLCDNEIPKTEQEIVNTQAECDQTQTEIDDLVEAHKECLELLEKQRQIDNAIRNAEKEGNKIQSESDNVATGAENASEAIGGRAGSPGQKADDEEELGQGSDCQEQAQKWIDEGKEKLQEAKAANGPGGAGAETAQTLIDEALALFKKAKDKLEEAKDHINKATSSALARKPKECEEGFEEVSEFWMIRWKTHYDLAYSKAERSPEEWARFKDNADQINNTLSFLSKLSTTPNIFKDFGMFAIQIGYDQVFDQGDIGGSAVSLFAGWLDRNGLAPVDLWIRRRGNCVLIRKTVYCENGCLETKHEIIREGKEIDEEHMIDTIKVAENRAIRTQQLLANYFKSNESRISVPEHGQCP